MRTAAILSTLAAIGCGEPEQPPAVVPQTAEARQNTHHELGRANTHDPNRYEARTRDDCARYSERPEFFGFCLYRVAQRGEGALGVDHFCDGAGTWETDCRDGWTIARARPDSTWTNEVLLAACGTIDCRFEVLDFRPNPEVTEQVSLCSRHAGRFGGDCAAHAMDRWLKGTPTEQEFSALAELEFFPDRIGHYMGLSVSCFDLGDCGSEGEAADRCKYTVGVSEINPELCRNIRANIH